MGEARRRKLAGTYPVRDTPESIAAFDALLRSDAARRPDPAVERFLAGHGGAEDLTPEQVEHARRILATWKFR